MRLKPKRSKIKRIIRVVLISMVGFIIIAGLSIYLLLHNYIHKMNLVDTEEADRKAVQTEVSDLGSDHKSEASAESGAYTESEQVDSGNSLVKENAGASSTTVIEQNVAGIFSGQQAEQDQENQKSQQSIDEYQDQETGQEQQTAQNQQAGQNQQTGQEQQTAQEQQTGQEQQLVQEQQTGQNQHEDQQNQQSQDNVQSVQALQNQAEDIILMEDSKVMNLLLIGYDGKSYKEGGKSDSVSILTVNRKTKKIITTSLSNNIYLQMPGGEKATLGSIYSLGGVDLLSDTLQQNFKIRFDQYIMADFLTFIDIVDTIGGISMEVAEEAIEPVNLNIMEINKQIGDDLQSDLLLGEKTYQLNGKQALGYSRNWFTEEGKYIRAGMQKEIVLAIFDKVKQFNFIELNGFLNIILPQITTNLSESEILEMFFMMPSYFNYETEQLNIPLSGTYKSLKKGGKTVVDINLEKNCKELYKQLYNVE